MSRLTKEKLHGRPAPGHQVFAARLRATAGFTAIALISLAVGIGEGTAIHDFFNRNIVGVVADTRNRGLLTPVEPEIFIPMEQQTAWNQLFLLARAALPPDVLLPLIRREIAAVDAEQPVYAIQTLEDAMGTAVFQQRLSAVLLAVFAGVALGLAAIGIYGVMSYSVAARTQEIGVRLAIGAARGDVTRLVMGQVVRLSAGGLVLGLAAAALLAPALRGLLHGVDPHDPVTLAAVAIALSAVAALAGWVPARRASRVDPLVALRTD